MLLGENNLKSDNNTNNLKLVKVMAVLVLALHIHNILHYNPNFGFDGKDHLEYVKWVAEKKSMPVPHEGWQFYQPPLYYVVASILWSLRHNEVLVQWVNLLVFAGIGLVLWKYNKSTVGMMAFLALPMVNYLVPLITNELMSGLFIVWGLVKILNLLKKEEVTRKDVVLLGVIFTLGFYTKYTMLSLLPIFTMALFLLRKKLSNLWKVILITGIISLVLISPILIRNYKLYNTPIALTDSFYQFQQKPETRDWKFFSRMDWVIKQDLFKSHHYSFWGGIWNTFWHDGQNAITPIVEFHKKAYVLFLLGFPLSVLALMGLATIWQENQRVGIVLFGYTVLAVVSLAWYTIKIPYYFTVKAFYTLGLIVPYVYGLDGFVRKQRKWKLVVMGLLLVQFSVMVSYFYIQPWWHVAK